MSRTDWTGVAAVADHLVENIRDRMAEAARAGAPGWTEDALRRILSDAEYLSERCDTESGAAELED
jgi:hypothetical protein